ncbi:MAG: aspartyl-tRNA(Asn)/glutamyl-tRNA(Gln) amidotransferase subunit A [Paracoccaceae bacterium]|jgi:aspartyl-tRNA(Asn)/glutamyl-tRNA(Gln) amidotransferase subunit A|tara:strand:- start:1293 stop:2621 length:1329 start_codon:yes stop_codon:yes gene_type:complete
MNDWLKMTACDLGRGIGAGDIDPVALTQTYLDAIEAHELKDRIYARVTADRALAEAKAASARAQAGQRLSLLDGVPVSWKDLFDTAGVGTEAGTKLLKGRIPDHDAVVLANATAMGLVCLGKTHMSELAFSGLGYNPSTNTPPCVNDADAVPGGSSSGAAASVAFDLAAAGIGSDTGGSVRIPAAWNDLVGLKTTSGRLSLEGVVPLVLKFDTVGPLTRSVEDAAELLALMEGGKAADLRGATLKGRKFAVLRTVMLDDLRDAPKAAFETALEKVQAAGARIEYIDVPAASEVLELSTILMTSEAYGLWKDVIEANPDAMYFEILKRFRIGANHLASDYIAAVNKLEAARGAYDAATAGYDAVLAPSSAILPPNLERLNTEEDYYVTENLLSLRNTRVGNLLGLCGLTLPTDTPSCGIMFLCAPDMEEHLLRIGSAAEAALA